MPTLDHDAARELILDTFKTRFTCKRYDPTRHVSDEDFDALLEVARMSPSSFGLEPWQLLVVEDEQLLADVLDVSWGAKRGADRTVIILARRGVNAQSAYAEHIVRDVKGTPEDKLAGWRETFGNFQKNNLHVLDSERTLFDWASKQTYIVLGNLLTSAALLGIDATPVEGYDRDALEALLAERGLIDPKELGVSVLVQFGYHDPSHFEPHQTRRPAAEVIERA